MMRFKTLLNLHRSIFGQMLILSVLFILGSIYYFAIQPVVNIDFSKSTPQDYTVEKVRQQLRGFIDQQLNGGNATEIQFPEEFSVFFQQNPQFHYYLRVNGHNYSNGDSLFYYTLKLDQVDQANQPLTDTPLCSYYMQQLNEPSGAGFIQYSFCNKQSFYLEFTGINVPVFEEQTTVWDYYQRMVWSGSRSVLINSLGVFVITALILFFNFRLMRKLANVAYSFDPKKLDQKLPEKGMPAEVLPLVQAVNEMIARVDATQQQHNFFLSTAAHEMRTPLTVLRTRLELLDDGEIKDKLIDDVRRLISLVNQLLRLMRIGGPKSLEQEIDVVQCCQRVLRERGSYAQESGVTLTFSSDLDALVLLGDEGLLEVAIANLVDNAVSFSVPDSQVLLHLNSQGELTVRDFGPGIPTDKLKALFEPFAKFPPNRNGHGLGLAIVKAITQLHQADVTAKNAEGGGAEFTIQFHAPRT
ncbi:sensor histidine kinase [Shewanella avicenniae]|nr:HAMP domain-containing sensor histidine kinase [Shewanella avicenniae]